MAQPPDDGEQEDQRDWTSLPPELLRLCFSALRWSRTDRTPKRGALASCKGFARAALRASLNALSWDLDEEGRPASSFSRAARLSAQLWGEEEEEAARGRGVALEVFSKRQASPEARCMAALCAANACLPFVTRLQLRGVALDVLLPAGLGALLPNLRTVLLLSCSLTPAARTTLLDVAAPPLPTQLQELRVDSLLSEDGLDEADEEAATAQLVQLAHLPGLATVQLMYCPTAFLETVGAQLTALHLDEEYQKHGDEEGDEDDDDDAPSRAFAPAPAWRATLQHAAYCTRLQHLTIPCATAEELGLVAPALKQLRDLRLADDLVSTVGVDGDAVLELLLGLPHLTSLHWKSCEHAFRRWHGDAPCRWERLTLDTVTPHALSRLPLRSLKQPVQWAQLAVGGEAPLLEVRAAVASVTQPSRCPAGFRWAALRPGQLPHVWFGPGLDVAACLRALQPLLASLTAFSVAGVEWDEEVVKVLGEVLPRACVVLALHEGDPCGKVLEQVAVSLPWVQRLHLVGISGPPDAAVELARAAARLRSQGKPVQLAQVVASQWAFRPGMCTAPLKRAWEQAAEELEREGLGVQLVLRLS